MAIEHRLRWTPDGMIVQRYDDERLVAEATYGGIDEALNGLRVDLEAREEAYHFPPDQYPTADHIAAEKLARKIARGISSF